MFREKQLVRPIDAYRAIIDQLVTETSYGVSEKLISNEGIFSRSPTEDTANAFVRSLSIEQRANLAKIVHAERNATIHDVLAALSWWVEAGEVGLTFRGEPMPVDVSGMGLHGDYIGRQQGWEWPNL